MTPLHSAPHPLVQRAPESVDVFTVRPPDWPYIELALIGTSYGLDDARRLAGQMGCDAIFLLAPLHGRIWTHTRATCLVSAN